MTFRRFFECSASSGGGVRLCGASRGVREVLLVGLQVVGQLVDFIGENGNLNFARPCVRVVRFEL